MRATANWRRDPLESSRLKWESCKSPLVGGGRMRRSVTLLFAATALLFSAPAAFAGAQSFTLVQKDVTESFTDVVACVGESADVTITYNFVLHVTELDNGTFHLTGTSAGRF